MTTVLIVDDEIMFLDSLAEGLQTLTGEFAVLKAINGRLALEILDQQHVDVVLTDLRMPEMDGFALVAEMSGRFPTIPIIVMTAFGTPRIEEDLRSRGIHAYLEKPLAIGSVIDLIREVIGRRHTGYREDLLFSFLPLIAMEKLTCRLSVSCASGQSGYFDFTNGDLINAGTDTLQSEEAAIDMLTWPQPRIFIGDAVEKKRTINTLLDDLLLLGLSRKEGEKPAQSESKGPKLVQTTRPASVYTAALEGSTVEIDVSRLNGAVASLVGQLGEGLVSTEIIFGPTSTTLASSGDQSGSFKDLSLLAEDFNQVLSTQGYPRLGHYFFADLEDQRSIIVLLFGPFRWSMLLNLEKTQRGYVFNVVMPSAVNTFADCIATR